MCVCRSTAPTRSALTDDGNLQLGTSVGKVSHSRPFAYQLRGGRMQPVACEYQLDRRTLSFVVGEHDLTQPLIIDPTVYCTLVGGLTHDYLYDAKTDAAGNTYACGETWSTDYPATPGAYSTANHSLGSDGTILKLSPTGHLLFATYIGGTLDDACNSIAIDPATGNIVVGGGTESGNFPVTAGAYQTVPGSTGVDYGDWFLSILPPSGASLLYSTRFGGIGGDRVDMLAVSSGQVVATGFVGSPNLPVSATGSPVNAYAGGGDVFIARFNATLSGLLFSGYYGGAGSDIVWTARLSGNDLCLAGYTTSGNLPITSGAWQASHLSLAAASPLNEDGFVARVSTLGGGMSASTYLGGRSQDQVRGIDVAANGDIVVAGRTSSGPGIGAVFPTTLGAYSTVFGGAADVFVSRMTPNLGGLVFSTFLGGANADAARSVALAADGSVLVTGATYSTNYPTTSGGAAVLLNGVPMGDVFFTRVAANGSALLHSFLRGGSAYEQGDRIHQAPNGDIVVAGTTNSTLVGPPAYLLWTPFPVTHAAVTNTSNSTYGAIAETFVWRFSLGLTGPVESSTNVGTGCGTGSVLPFLSANAGVLGGNLNLSLLQAPPLTAGVLFFGNGGIVPLGNGCTAWVNPATAAPLFNFTTGPTGQWSVSVPLPSNPSLSGATFSTQTLLLYVGGPLGFGGLSNGVASVVGG